MNLLGSARRERLPCCSADGAGAEEKPLKLIKRMKHFGEVDPFR